MAAVRADGGRHPHGTPPARRDTRPGRQAATRPPGALVVAVLVLALALTAACGTVGNQLPQQALPLPDAATATAAAGTSTGTGTRTGGAPAPADCGDPRASLRPPAVLPAPGAMPAGSHLRAIADRGHLTVGVLADVPPFGYIDPLSGEFAGFDVEIARLIGRAIFGADDHVRFRAVTYAERIPVLLDGTVDLVVATMTTNCERRAKVDFSAVYYEETNRILVLAKSPYRSLADLGGRRVCAAAGTTSIEHVERADPRPVAVAVPTIGDCLVALQAGTVDGISTAEAVLSGLAAQDPRVAIVGPRFDSEPDAIAVSRDHPELTRFVNGVLERTLADGTWRGLARDWLTGIEPVIPVPRYRD